MGFHPNRHWSPKFETLKASSRLCLVLYGCTHQHPRAGTLSCTSMPAVGDLWGHRYLTDCSRGNEILCDICHCKIPNICRLAPLHTAIRILRYFLRSVPDFSFRPVLGDMLLDGECLRSSIATQCQHDVLTRNPFLTQLWKHCTGPKSEAKTVPCTLLET